MAAYVFNSLEVSGLIHGSGLNVRTPVRAATVAAGTLASSFANGSTIDGVALATNDRILIKDQASPIENGIYVVQATGAPVRAEDFSAGFGAAAVTVTVREGTANRMTQFIISSAPGADVVGTNNVTVQRSAGIGGAALSGSAIDNNLVRFDGTTGLIQGSAVTVDDIGNFTGVGTIVLARPTNNLTLTAADQTSGPGTATIPNLAGASQNVTMVSLAQTLSNKTLAAPTVTGDILFDKATNDLTFVVADQLTGAATLTVPSLGGVSQNVVVTTLAQTLTNKTLDNPIVINDMRFQEASGTVTFAVTDQTNATLTLPSLGGTGRSLVLDTLTQTLTNKTLAAPLVTGDIVFDKATNDLTMIVTDQASGAANATIPDFGGISQTFLFTALAQTVSNKTLGTNLNAGGFRITNLADPTGATDAANKQYVDSVSSGLDPKESCRVATVANVGTYTVGSPDSLASVANTQDGVTLVVGNRVLVRAQTDARQNGIYRVTVVAGTSTMVRATDMNGTPPSNVSSGNFTFVEQGTTLASTGWVVQGNGVLTLNTDNIVWTQFSGAGTYTAGSGLTLTGSTFSANTSGVTTGVQSNAIIVRSTATAGQVMRSTGTAGNEAAWGALDLTSANAVTGALTVPNGGTGANTFTSGNLLQGNGTSAITATAIATSAVVTLTGTQTLTNKSLTDATTFFIDDVDATKRLQFQLSGIATATTRTLTIPDANTTIVGTDTTQTLTNKTLTAPQFADLGFIADSAGNELLIFDSNTSAVNNFQINNTASTVAPVLSVVGGDTNIGMQFQAKGTGVFTFLATSATQAEIRLQENTGSGTDFIAIRSPATLASSYTLTLPADDGLPNQLLQTNGTGGLTWVNAPAARVSYSIISVQVNATSTTPTAAAFHAWLNSEYTDLGTSCRVIFWAANLTNRNLTVTLHDGTASIGTITVNSGTADGPQSFTFTKPSSNVRLELRVSKSAAGGTNPSVFAAQLEFTA